MSESIAHLVYKYVKDHPGCKCVDAARDLGLKSKSVNNRLFKLREAGKIKRNNTSVGRKVSVSWEVGVEPHLIEDNPRDGSVHQKTVKIWEPHLFRDPFVAMLFGKAP